MVEVKHDVAVITEYDVGVSLLLNIRVAPILQAS